MTTIPDDEAETRILACRSFAALSRLSYAWRAEGVTIDAKAQAVMDAHQRALVEWER